MKKRFITPLIIIALAAGLSLILYPTVSNWWNVYHQSRAIIDYSNEVESLSDEDYSSMIDSAAEYNKALLSKSRRFVLTGQELVEYKSLINISGGGSMGYIDIPRINVSIPIYHTASDDVLQFAAGHIPGTSLPVGGEGTHCAVSGHRGLPSARLFTDLDKLQLGDVFTVYVLKEELTYQIDRINTVLPSEVEALAIDPSEDRFTLITCTPYGVNTHRLLVSGTRIEPEHGLYAVRFTSEAIRIEPVMVAPFVAAPLLLVLLIMLVTGGGKESKREGN